MRGSFVSIEVGRRFGRLVVVARRERGDKKVSVVCDCGAEKQVIASKLTNDGNYEPGNCRWATPKEQAANRRVRKDSLSLR